MLKKTSVRIAGVALVAAAALGATACSAQSSDSSSSDSPSSQVIAPVIVNVTDLQGKTIEVGLNNMVDIVADDVTAWSGEVTDPLIAEFIAGTSEGDSEDALKTNPGLKPLAAGETTVTMTSTDGTTVTFTLKVIA